MKVSTLDLFGFTLSEAKERTGLGLGTLYRHAHGEPVSPKIAIIYHDKLGVNFEAMNLTPAVRALTKSPAQL